MLVIKSFTKPLAIVNRNEKHENVHRKFYLSNMKFNIKQFKTG